jgi:hypothetical protein
MHNPAVTAANAPVPPPPARKVSGASALAPLLAGLLLATLGLFGGVGCGGTTDDRPAKWSFISTTIIQPTCATVGCHSDLAEKAAVDLHDREGGYKVLTDRHYVSPGHPEDSALIGLMHADGAIRMPPDYPLPEADIQLIERWILDGAKNN